MSSAAFPDDRSYTDDHEWVLIAPGADLPDEPVRVGITSVAVNSLGELVFVDLPEVGTTIVAGESCGEVESTKTVSELYPPVSGRVTLINTAAVDDPGLVTSDRTGRAGCSPSSRPRPESSSPPPSTPRRTERTHERPEP